MSDGNITTDHSKKGLDLNVKGTGRLALNIITHIRHFSQYSGNYHEIISSYKLSCLNPNVEIFVPSEKTKGLNDSDDIFPRISRAQNPISFPMQVTLGHNNYNTDLSDFTCCEIKSITLQNMKRGSTLNPLAKKAIMVRSRLRNKSLKLKTIESREAYNTQRNYCVSLLRQVKKDFYEHWNPVLISDVRNSETG